MNKNIGPLYTTVFFVGIIMLCQLLPQLSPTTTEPTLTSAPATTSAPADIPTDTLTPLDPATATQTQTPLIESDAFNGTFPAVSSDGKFAFLREIDANNYWLEYLKIGDEYQTSLTLIPKKYIHSAPVWSNDGTRLAWIISSSEHTAFDTARIYTYDVVNDKMGPVLNASNTDRVRVSLAAYGNGWSYVSYSTSYGDACGDKRVWYWDGVSAEGFPLGIGDPLQNQWTFQAYGDSLAYHQTCPSDSFIVETPFGNKEFASDEVDNVFLSPDGNKVLLPKGKTLQMYDFQTEFSVTITDNLDDNGFVNWSQDSKTIAWIEGSTINVYDVASGQSRVLTTTFSGSSNGYYPTSLVIWDRFVVAGLGSWRFETFTYR